MDERYQHIIQYIRNSAHELSSAAATFIRSIVLKIYAIKFKFIGGAYTENTVSINSGNNKLVVIPLKVDPTKHLHSLNSLITEPMLGTNSDTIKNTAVLRSPTGDIYSTGYKLSDGKDISTLFIKLNTTNVEVETKNINSSGSNAIVSMTLTKNNNKLVLTNNWGWICNCGVDNVYCQCCD